jgi:hypothetical protein
MYKDAHAKISEVHSDCITRATEGWKSAAALCSGGPAGVGIYRKVAWYVWIPRISARYVGHLYFGVICNAIAYAEYKLEKSYCDAEQEMRLKDLERAKQYCYCRADKRPKEECAEYLK